MKLLGQIKPQRWQLLARLRPKEWQHQFIKRSSRYRAPECGGNASEKMLKDAPATHNPGEFPRSC